MAKKTCKRSPDIRLLVVFSDLHSGSRRSLMPPTYDLFEEGELKQTITANKQQLWLYDCWCRGWEKVIKYVGGDPWAWAFNGDAIEGTHRAMTEIVSKDTGDTVEMKLAEKLKCERHPDTGQWAADRWMLNINGFNLLLRHHIQVTSREYLRGSALTIEFGNEVVAAQNRGQPTPQGIVFAHRHGYDWWNGKNTVAMVCGPWQQTTRYGHTKWSPMIPEPTLTVLDWRDSPIGGMPIEKTFAFSPQAATVTNL
jgi:hypothetical protein